MFRIAGNVHSGSVLVLPDRTIPWMAAEFEAVDIAGLEPVMAASARVDILLLGCGPTMQLPSRQLRNSLRECGIVVEPMDTGAACRTFNVLLSEARPVAAALIALPAE
jgi:uncharacterized protein